MSSYEERDELRLFLQPDIPNKLVILTTNGAKFKGEGKSHPIQASTMFLINQSPDHVPTIDCDNLTKDAQVWVFDTAAKPLQEAADIVYSKLKGKYPSHCVNVWVWEKNTINNSPCKSSKGWACFKCSNNPAYGHDVFVILS